MVSYYAMKKDTSFTIAGRTFNSRLLVGSGKYKDLEETRLATEKSGSEIITVAIRRTNIGQNPNEESLLDVISPEKYTILPNTAGCYNARATPPSVPPVPAEHTNPETSPLVCSQISGPVVS